MRYTFEVRKSNKPRRIGVLHLTEQEHNRLGNILAVITLASMGAIFGLIVLLALAKVGYYG